MEGVIGGYYGYIVISDVVLIINENCFFVLNEVMFYVYGRCFLMFNIIWYYFIIRV